MSKKITFAGFSYLDGKLKFRTATGAGRVAQLKRTDTDLNMIEIEPCDTKAQAAKQLLALDHAQGNRAVEELYTYKTLDENPFALSGKTVTVKAPAKVSTKAKDKMSPKEAEAVREELNATLKAAYEAN